MNRIYPKVDKTDNFVVKQAKRSETCSLKNAIHTNIDGKLFCLAHFGQKKHKDALRLCQSLNATLPLPKSITEHNNFIESLKRLGINEKINDFSTKIVLNIRRQTKGKVSL